ncbi:hypothetical protein [Auritidibacter sp. NML120636]|nr:hypothetical protein [Auritidibacter sp. NML120636]
MANPEPMTTAVIAPVLRIHAPQAKPPPKSAEGPEVVAVPGVLVWGV